MIRARTVSIDRYEDETGALAGGLSRNLDGLSVKNEIGGLAAASLIANI